MIINDLPDTCLITIFKCIETFDDLYNCGKVCKRWNLLINQRLNNVKLLSAYSDSNYPEYVIHFDKSLALKDNTIGQLLPNLKILDIQWRRLLSEEDIIHLLDKCKSIRGLIYNRVFTKNIIRVCNNIEMLVTGCNDTYFPDIINNIGTQLTQVYTYDLGFRQLEIYAEYLENLQRIHTSFIPGFSNHVYNGPKYKSLEILEISMDHQESTSCFTGFHFIDFCPSLVSCYFDIYNAHNITCNTSLKHYLLRDLVIDYHFCDNDHGWSTLRDCLSKFINLKHLGIKKSRNFKSHHIDELLMLLPNLKILDVRCKNGIDYQSANNIVQSYQKNGRLIEIFTYNEQLINLDWAELSRTAISSRLCQPYDFMRHCFLKFFTDLPFIIDSVD